MEAGRGSLTIGPAEEEEQLAQAVLQILEGERADSIPYFRLQIQCSGLEEQLDRLGISLEDLFARNEMQGEHGYYVYSRTDNGVPRIDRIYPREEDQREVVEPSASSRENMPPFVGQNPNFPLPPNLFPPPAPFVGRPNGRGPPPMFSPMPIPLILAPPMFHPTHAPRQMAAAPPPPPPQQQPPPEPKFVRMPQFYKIVSDLVHNSKTGRISLENLFDAIEDVLSEKNLRLNHIQSRDMGGVIDRGIQAGEMDVVLKDYTLYTRETYKGFLESQRVEPSPVDSLAEQFQQTQWKTQSAPNDIRQTPQPFGFNWQTQHSNSSQQMPLSNGVPQMQKEGEFPQENSRRNPENDVRQNSMRQTRSVAQTPCKFVDTEEESTPKYEQLRAKKDLSNISYCSDLTGTTTTESSSILSRPRTFDSTASNRFSTASPTSELDPWREQIIFDYLTTKTTLSRPRGSNERYILSLTVEAVVARWGRKVKKLPEVMLLLKSLWLERPRMNYNLIHDNMFEELGFGGLNWYKLGVVPDDLASLRMYEPAPLGKVAIEDLEKTDEEKVELREVELHKDIQVLSLYQFAPDSLAAQIYKILSQFSTVDPFWIPFSDVMRNTSPMVLSTWKDFSCEEERLNYIVEELNLHDEIFEMERKGVQLRLPLAHLVVI